MSPEYWKLSLSKVAIFAILLLMSATVVSAAEGDCLTCHGDDPGVLSLKHSVHGGAALTSGQCETCHGPSLAHRKAPRQNVPDQIFSASGTASAIDSSEVCSGCHLAGAQKHWFVSEHAGADIACDACHSIHADSDPVLLRQGQVKVCTSCHSEQKADAMKFSRHPVMEGVVSCSDCHDPHGGKGPSMLKEATVNETCYSCHTEKRGPFLWEHEPVQDDCTHCHTPHGSINDNLLVIRQPLLCQQCHISTSHRGTNYIKGQNVLGNDFVYGKSCLNCHGEIHGTNHAQGGAYFE
jgi:DmsE family decaheme c-type cytochrome